MLERNHCIILGLSQYRVLCFTVYLRTKPSFNHYSASQQLPYMYCLYKNQEPNQEPTQPKLPITTPPPPPPPKKKKKTKEIEQEPFLQTSKNVGSYTRVLTVTHRYSTQLCSILQNFSGTLACGSCAFFFVHKHILTSSK